MMAATLDNDIKHLIYRLKSFNRENPGWCCLHQIQDGNIEDDHVEYCKKTAQERGHDKCLLIAKLWEKIPESFREQAMEHVGQMYQDLHDEDQERYGEISHPSARLIAQQEMAEIRERRKKDKA